MIGLGDYFVIEGGVPLNGEIQPAGNKNAALPTLAACLLTDEPVTLRNMPAIRDVEVMAELLAALGVSVERLEKRTWRLHAKDLASSAAAELSPQQFRAIRGSILIVGPLLARLGRLNIPAPGGDVIGRRRVDTHFLAFQGLGAEIGVEEGRFQVWADRLTGADILLDEASVTGTENGIMAAVLAKGTTILRNAASEPHVQDLCRMLNVMGAQISGIGTNTLTIEGVDRLHGVDFTIGSDHIEIGSYLALAAATHGEILIRDAFPENLRMILGGPRYGRRHSIDRGFALAGVPCGSDEHCFGSGDAVRGRDHVPRQDVREPALLRGQADPDGCTDCALRPAPCAGIWPLQAIRGRDGEPRYPRRYGDADCRVGCGGDQPHSQHPPDRPWLRADRGQAPTVGRQYPALQRH